MKYYCNPINISYKYQFIQKADGRISVSREAADPSMIMFKGRYYIFPSMTCGFLYSDDLVEWKFHPLKGVPTYDYAPDVRVVGDYVYFCASSSEKNCSFYRTKDLFKGDFEEIKGTFPFWDPNLFVDDDGRMYLYWGCSNTLPIYGVELNPSDMTPIGEKKELIFCNNKEIGYERSGENHVPPRSPEQIAEMLKSLEETDGISEEMKSVARAYIIGSPYIEGAWMTKHNGKYYLQYATPGSQYNIYADGVYIGETPLGPFKLAKNNPFSYKPGGFIPGAGHGSTMEDKFGNLWHVATMRISVNHQFERRIGIWPAGWDNDGEMFCNQRFGDWPVKVEQAKLDPWAKPEWMLLSYGKNVKASSYTEERMPSNVTDENVQTCWKAASNKPGEWIEVDLGKEYDVHAVQINFADDGLTLPLPEGAELKGPSYQKRWIDETHQPTRWKLEGSTDGKEYFVIEDKSKVDTDLPHDLIVREKGIRARYIRLTVFSVPYGQPACLSGLRVFGRGNGKAPSKATNVLVKRVSDLDIDVSWKGEGTGYVVVWGYAPEKLYHSYQVFGESVRIGGLVKGQDTYIRIDSFNENGITEGDIIMV